MAIFLIRNQGLGMTNLGMVIYSGGLVLPIRRYKWTGRDLSLVYGVMVFKI